MLGSIYFFLWELFTAPKVFLGKHVFWRAYRKGLPLFHSIKAYDNKHEMTYARHVLTSWYQNPSDKTLEADLLSIVAVRSVLREKIRTSELPITAYHDICDAVRTSHKHGWEIIIGELSKMTIHLREFKGLVISMSSDSNQKVRETALLVMEDGKFSKAEKKQYYSAMLFDKSKKIRERAIDMIVRENVKFRNELGPVIKSVLLMEKDQDIIDGLNYALSKK